LKMLDGHTRVGETYEFGENLHVDLVRLKHNKDGSERWMLNLFHKDGKFARKVDSRAIVNVDADGEIRLENQRGQGGLPASFASKKSFTAPSERFLAEAGVTSPEPLHTRAIKVNLERPPVDRLAEREKFYSQALNEKDLPPDKMFGILMKFHGEFGKQIDTE